MGAKLDFRLIGDKGDASSDGTVCVFAKVAPRSSDYFVAYLENPFCCYSLLSYEKLSFNGTFRPLTSILSTILQFGMISTFTSGPRLLASCIPGASILMNF